MDEQSFREMRNASFKRIVLLVNLLVCIHEQVATDECYDYVNDYRPIFIDIVDKAKAEIDRFSETGIYVTEAHKSIHTDEMRQLDNIKSLIQSLVVSWGNWGGIYEAGLVESRIAGAKNGLCELSEELHNIIEQ